MLAHPSERYYVLSGYTAAPRHTTQAARKCRKGKPSNVGEAEITANPRYKGTRWPLG